MQHGMVWPRSHALLEAALTHWPSGSARLSPHASLSSSVSPKLLVNAAVVSRAHCVNAPINACLQRHKDDRSTDRVSPWHNDCLCSPFRHGMVWPRSHALLEAALTHWPSGSARLSPHASLSSSVSPKLLVNVAVVSRAHCVNAPINACLQRHKDDRSTDRVSPWHNDCLCSPFRHSLHSV